MAGSGFGSAVSKIGGVVSEGGKTLANGSDSVGRKVGEIAGKFRKAVSSGQKPDAKPMFKYSGSTKSV